MTGGRLANLGVVTCDEGELDCELGGDLADDILGEVAGGDGGVGHQHEDCVRHLLQLAVGEVCGQDVTIMIIISMLSLNSPRFWFSLASSHL